LQLKSAPDYTTVYRFLLRLDPADATRVMEEIARRMPRRGRSRATVAIDATGLSQSAMSTFFVRRMHYHTQQPMPWRHWLKWLVVIDVERQLILAQNARQAPWNDCASLPALVQEAHQHTPVGCVLADAEFDSERNHRFCREQLHAKSIIPAKRFTSHRATGYRQQMRTNFPRRRYRCRSLIESVFSTVKRKLSSRAPERTLATQTRQALLLGLAYNLYRLKPLIFSIRMSTEPDGLY
jgi:IS5 family transposase